MRSHETTRGSLVGPWTGMTEWLYQAPVTRRETCTGRPGLFRLTMSDKGCHPFVVGNPLTVSPEATACVSYGLERLGPGILPPSWRVRWMRWLQRGRGFWGWV